MKSKQDFGDINLSTDNAYQVDLLELFCWSFSSLPDRLHKITRHKNCAWTALKNRREIGEEKKSFSSKGDNWKHFYLTEKWQKFP